MSNSSSMFVLAKNAVKFFLNEKLVFSINLRNDIFSVFVSKAESLSSGKSFLMKEFKGATVVLMICLKNMGWDIDWEEISKFLFDKRVAKIFELNLDNGVSAG